MTDDQIVLGEITCDEKGNEITAIPDLLDMVNVEKSVVTIDAMGTQTEIAKKIIEKKADYCLALKENQSSIHDVSIFSRPTSIGSTGARSGLGFAQ